MSLLASSPLSCFSQLRLVIQFRFMFLSLVWLCLRKGSSKLECTLSLPRRVSCLRRWQLSFSSSMSSSSSRMMSKPRFWQFLIVEGCSIGLVSSCSSSWKMLYGDEFWQYRMFLLRSSIYWIKKNLSSQVRSSRAPKALSRSWSTCSFQSSSAPHPEIACFQ